MKKSIGFFLFVMVAILGWRGAISAEPSIFAHSTQQPHLTRMNALIAETGLTDLIDKHGPFTLVAPSDAAFAMVEERLATLDATQKRQLVLYHLVHGEVHSADLANYTLLGTAFGQPIQVIQQDGIAWLNGKTTFSAAEQVGANGVLHMVDTVLFPGDVPTIAPPAATASPVNPTVVPTPEPMTSSELFFDYEGPRAEPRVWFELGHVDGPVGIGPAERMWDSAEFALSVNTIYNAVQTTQQLLPQLNAGATAACDTYFDNYLLVTLAPIFSNVPDNAVEKITQYESAITVFLDRNRPHVHFCLNGGTFSQFNYNLAWMGVNDTLPILNGLRGAVGATPEQETVTRMQNALHTLLNRTHIPLETQH